MDIFHFHTLKKNFSKVYAKNFSDYELKRNQKNLSCFYKDYLQELDKVNSGFNLSSNIYNQEIRFSQSLFGQSVRQALNSNLTVPLC